ARINAAPPPCVCLRPNCRGSGGEGDRTPDLVNAMHALSQQSYAPNPRPRHIARASSADRTFRPLPTRTGAGAAAGTDHGPYRSPHTTSPSPHRARTDQPSSERTARPASSTRHDSCRTTAFFAKEPLNLSACISGVNRAGLAEFVSAGILHDFVGARTRAPETVYGTRDRKSV